jgi:hypothetical protein
MPFADNLASRVFERLAAIDFSNTVELGPKHEGEYNDVQEDTKRSKRFHCNFGVYVVTSNPIKPVFVQMRHEGYKTLQKSGENIVPFHDWLISYIRDVTTYIDFIKHARKLYFDEKDKIFSWKKNGESEWYELRCKFEDRVPKLIQSDEGLYLREPIHSDPSANPNYMYTFLFAQLPEKFPSKTVSCMVSSDYLLRSQNYILESEYNPLTRRGRQTDWKDFWKTLKQSQQQTENAALFCGLEPNMFFLFHKVQALRLHCASVSKKTPMEEESLEDTLESCMEQIRIINTELEENKLKDLPLEDGVDLVSGFFKEHNCPRADKPPAPTRSDNHSPNPYRPSTPTGSDNHSSNTDRPLTPTRPPTRRKQMARDGSGNKGGETVER